MIPIMRRALAKIQRNLREQTQSDDLLAFSPNEPRAGGAEEETRSSAMTIAITQLNLLLPSVPLYQLEQHLSPHLAPHSLLHETVFVSGFDNQVDPSSSWLSSLFTSRSQTTMNIAKLIVLGSGTRSAILTEKITKCLLGPLISDRSPTASSSLSLSLTR
jgi:hypothetical protein